MEEEDRGDQVAHCDALEHSPPVDPQEAVGQGPADEDAEEKDDERSFGDIDVQLHGCPAACATPLETARHHESDEEEEEGPDQVVEREAFGCVCSDAVNVEAIFIEAVF